MAVVTLMAVFPPVLFFNVTLIPQLRDVQVVLRTFILCLGVVPIVTWIMMPRLQRLLRGWLSGTRPPARIDRTNTAPAGPQSSGYPGEQDPAPAESFPRFRPATVPTGNRYSPAGAPSARVTYLDPADPYLRRSR